MALTEIPSELSSTPSIVDNGNATAITIDASENVTFSGTLNGISTTKSASGNRWGILPEVESNGVMEVGRYLDFHSTDGDTADYGARLDYNGTNIVSTNAFAMSSGIYLGGTAAANKLDDYEEGDFTLVVSGGTTAGTNSGGNVGGRYTKIGRLVTCSLVVANTTLSGASGELRLTGFPFTPSNYGNRPPIGVVRMYRQDLAPQSSGYFAPTMEVVHGGNYAVFVQTKDNDTWAVVQVDNQSGLYYEGTITYTTV